MGQTRCINCMELIEDGSTSCPHCGYRQDGELSPFGIKPNTILKGRYIVGRILGQGGFGITYVGYDLTLDVKVAIKEYFPMGCATRNYTVSNQIQWNTTQFSREQWQQGSENFLKEARRMAKLDSLPGIVRVKDTFPENQTSYIVMEYIEGETLKQRLQKTGTMQIRDCIKLLTPLMESLAKMHQKGLIHRDISPDNIMIKPDGSACLLDFGAAKDVSFQQSIASQQVVKKGFSPPEQYGEKGKIGSWTDVYALCATIYYCVTGKLVPDAMDRMYEDTLDFSAPVKECMGETVADALRDGLKFRGEERIQTVEELLGRLSYEKNDTPGPDVPQPVVSVKKKNRKAILIAAVAVCFVLFLIGKASTKEEKFPNTLMEDSAGEEINDVYQANVLGSDIKRDSIVSVTFLDTLDDAPDTAWDVSWDQDGTVKAWTEQQDLFIGAKGGVKAKNCYRLFRGYYNVEKIEFNNCFDTGAATNMKSMFYDCGNLTELDVSGFDTSQVTDMGCMFYDCKGLTELDVSNFDTGAATNMKSMFCDCSSLTSLELDNFNTDNVTDMSYMFDNCKNLTKLDISSFDTSAVTDLSDMFSDCANLTKLDVSNFDTGAVTNMEAIFENCENLLKLDVSNFDTSQVIGMRWMFYGCKGLTELDLSNFDTGAATNMKSMFCGCENLTELDVSGFDTSAVTDMSYMFKDCKNLTELDVSSFDTSQVTNMLNMFDKCGNLTSLDVSGFNTSQVTNLQALFQDCNSITSLDVSGFNTSRATDMGWMFYGCNSLTELDVSNFDTGAVTNMKSMFNKCSSLKSLDVSNFNTDQVTDASYMFYQCTGLTGMDVSNFNIGEETDITSMFEGCSFTAEDAKIRINKNVLMQESAVQQSDGGIWLGTVLGSDISRDAIATVTFTDTLDKITDNAWDVSWDRDGTVMAWTQKNADNEKRYDLFIGAKGGVKGKDCSWLFAGYYNVEKIDFNNCFDTSAATSMYAMFYQCENLTSLDISSFDTGAVTSMAYMFGICKSLKLLDISGLNTSRVTNMEWMFGTCRSLTSLDVSSFDTGAVTTMNGMFGYCENLVSLDVSNFVISQVTDTQRMFEECGITAEQAGFQQN